MGIKIGKTNCDFFFVFFLVISLLDVLCMVAISWLCRNFVLQKKFFFLVGRSGRGRGGSGGDDDPFLTYLLSGLVSNGKGCI